MKLVHISPNPLAVNGNGRFVEYKEMRDIAGEKPELSQMELWYTAYTHETDEVDEFGKPISPEYTPARKHDRLTAVNSTRVDANGKIIEDALPTDGFGEYDFFIKALFSGLFTKQSLFELVVHNADEKQRFDKNYNKNL